MAILSSEEHPISGRLATRNSGGVWDGFHGQMGELSYRVWKRAEGVKY